jgi:hypothetical protein
MSIPTGFDRFSHNKLVTLTWEKVSNAINWNKKKRVIIFLSGYFGIK